MPLNVHLAASTTAALFESLALDCYAAVTAVSVNGVLVLSELFESLAQDGAQRRVCAG